MQIHNYYIDKHIYENMSTYSCLSINSLCFKNSTYHTCNIFLHPPLLFSCLNSFILLCLMYALFRSQVILLQFLGFHELTVLMYDFVCNHTSHSAGVISFSLLQNVTQLLSFIYVLYLLSCSTLLLDFTASVAKK